MIAVLDFRGINHPRRSKRIPKAMHEIEASVRKALASRKMKSARRAHVKPPRRARKARERRSSEEKAGGDAVERKVEEEGT